MPVTSQRLRLLQRWACLRLAAAPSLGVSAGLSLLLLHRRACSCRLPLSSGRSWRSAQGGCLRLACRLRCALCLPSCKVHAASSGDVWLSLLLTTTAIRGQLVHILCVWRDRLHRLAHSAIEAGCNLKAGRKVAVVCRRMSCTLSWRSQAAWHTMAL